MLERGAMSAFGRATWTWINGITKVVMIAALLRGSIVAGDGLAFDEASVRRIADSISPPPYSQRYSPGRIHFGSTTLMQLIAPSFAMKPYQIIGPGWLTSLRYDIDAVMPVGTSKDQLQMMIQQLLINRFGLKVHRTNKSLRVLDLTAGRVPVKLHPNRTGGGPSVWRTENGRFIATDVPLVLFSDILTQLLNEPVIDSTGISGSFDIDLAWVPQPSDLNSPGVDSTTSDSSLLTKVPAGSLSAAVREEMGLELKARRAPVQVLVVDRVEKTPTEN